jgi:hypothetical protein
LTKGGAAVSEKISLRLRSKLAGGVRLQDLKEQTPGAFLQFINGDLVSRIGRFKKNRWLDFGDY